jgi:hypothetical protein
MNWVYMYLRSLPRESLRPLRDSAIHSAARSLLPPSFRRVATPRLRPPLLRRSNTKIIKQSQSRIIIFKL